ncbi:MAG: protoporphyrinogen oxidase HemJ [Parafilimonas terrae]|nr:protoporphyrinogen oxidase HemJ [Parafilimonas terrae]
MADYYLWLKAVHVISIVAWMAAMLYLPRLFVYHAEAGPRTPQAETFKVMEGRLLRVICTPAMIAVWATGLLLAYEGGWFKSGWLHGKILLVVILTGVHGMLAASTRRFAADQDTRSPKFYRILNEVPTVLLVGIVVLVVVKPF